MFTLVEDYKYFRKLCQIATIITQQLYVACVQGALFIIVPYVQFMHYVN